MNICEGETEELSHFMQEVFSYGFKDKPNYEKLSNILRNLMKCDCDLNKK